MAVSPELIAEIRKALAYSDERMSQKRAADYLGVSTETLENYRRNGRLPFSYRGFNEVTRKGRVFIQYFGITYKKSDLDNLYKTI